MHNLEGLPEIYEKIKLLQKEIIIDSENLKKKERECVEIVCKCTLIKKQERLDKWKRIYDIKADMLSKKLRQSRKEVERNSRLFCAMREVLQQKNNHFGK